MPVGHELLIIALNGDSLAAGSTAHYPLTILNHRHKQPESSMCTRAHMHMHSLTRAWENQGYRSLSIALWFPAHHQLHLVWKTEIVLKICLCMKQDSVVSFLASPWWESIISVASSVLDKNKENYVCVASERFCFPTLTRCKMKTIEMKLPGFPWIGIFV